MTWGVLILQPGREPRWFTAEWHTQEQAERLAEYFMRKNRGGLYPKGTRYEAKERGD